MSMTVEQLSSEYAAYLKFDSTPFVKSVEDSIDETLTRLEEFETLLAMVKSDSEMPLTESVIRRKAEFLDICYRVRCLEEIVAHVRSGIDAAEAAVSAAENDLQRTDGLLSFVKPLFRRSQQTGSNQLASRGDKTVPLAPQFSISDFFLPLQQSDTSHS